MKQLPGFACVDVHGIAVEVIDRWPFDGMVMVRRVDMSRWDGCMRKPRELTGRARELAKALLRREASR
jgi:hypothetical protein